MGPVRLLRHNYLSPWPDLYTSLKNIRNMIRCIQIKGILINTEHLREDASMVNTIAHFIACGPGAWPRPACTQ